MKMLLVTGILLFCLYGVSSNALNRTKRQSVYLDKNKELEQANDFRRGMAKSGIANMHKVRWNDALTVPPCDQKAQEDVEELLVRVNQEVASVGVRENVPPTEEQKKALAAIITKVIGGILEVTAQMPNNCLHPLQTEMKCSADQVCTAAGRQSPNCICGPMTQPLKETDFVKGAPGSACKGKVEDGLCVNQGSTEGGLNQGRSLGSANEEGSEGGEGKKEKENNLGIMHQTIPTIICLAIFYLFA